VETREKTVEITQLRYIGDSNSGPGRGRIISVYYAGLAMLMTCTS